MQLCASSGGISLPTDKVPGEPPQPGCIPAWDPSAVGTGMLQGDLGEAGTGVGALFHPNQSTAEQGVELGTREVLQPQNPLCAQRVNAFTEIRTN